MMNIPFHFMLFKAFHAQRNQIRKGMDAFQLSPGQPKVLRYIAEHESCKLKDIAAACDVECATVSKLLSALEEKKMLTKESVRKDKRALCLQITKQGEEALRKWNLHCQEVEELSLKGFSEEERKAFQKYLGRMYENLCGKKLE